MSGARYDVVIVGGGIVGLAVAFEITQRFPRLRLLLLEKEARVGQHQSGHNSGVIHSGIYYKPGSLKAKLCVEGAREMVEFCRSHDLPYEICGKVIVATHEQELPRLEKLRRRGEANGLTGLRLIGPEELREIEPHASGLQALVVPSTGITDYLKVCEKYAELISAQSGIIFTSTAVIGIQTRGTEMVVETQRDAFSAGFLVNCAGLFSDRISRMAGDDPGVIIVPFRGEYYDLIPERTSLVRALIYPVPDPRFPFLGVHFTRRISGRVDAGPNAVLALRREGYRRTISAYAILLRPWPSPDFGAWLKRIGGADCTNSAGRFPGQSSFARCSGYSLKCASGTWSPAVRECAPKRWGAMARS